MIRFRRILALLALLSQVVAGASPAWACTGITIKTKGRCHLRPDARIRRRHHVEPDHRAEGQGVRRDHTRRQAWAPNGR